MRTLVAALAALIAVACSSKGEETPPASPAPTTAPEEVEKPPPAAADAGAPLAPELALTITADGKTLLAGTPVEAANLASELTKAAATTKALVIVPDPKVPHGRVLEIMELAKKAGFEKMSISTGTPP